MGSWLNFLLSLKEPGGFESHSLQILFYGANSYIRKRKKFVCNTCLHTEFNSRFMAPKFTYGKNLRICSTFALLFFCSIIHLVSSSSSPCSAPNVYIFFVFLWFGFLHGFLHCSKYCYIAFVAFCCGFFSLLRRCFLVGHRFRCPRHCWRSCALFANEAFSHKVGGFLNFLIFFNVMNLFFLCIIICIFSNLYYLVFIIICTYVMLVVSLE